MRSKTNSVVALVGTRNRNKTNKTGKGAFPMDEIRFDRPLFEQGPVVLFRWRNAEGWPVTDVTPNVRDIFGHPPEAFLNGEVRYADVVHPGDLERVGAEVTRATDTDMDHFHHEDYRIVRPDGQVRWVQDYTRVEWDGDRRTPVAFIGYLVDITRLKSVETALRQLRDSHEHKWRAYEETSLEGILFHRDGKLIECNNQFCRMFGYDDPDDLVGMDVLRIIAEESRATVERRIREHVDGAYEVMGRRRDGSTFPLLASARETEFRGSKVRAVSLRDLSDLKRAEAFTERVVDFLPDPVFVKDEQHRWVLLNKAMADLTGREAQDLLGKTDFDLFAEEEARVFWDMDRMVFETGEENLNTEHFTGPDGVKHIVATKKAVFDDDSGKRYLVGTIRDVTELENTKQALEHRTHELGERVKELRSLFALSNLVVQNEFDVPATLQAAADLIPPAFQYPEITVGRITLDGVSYVSAGFRETPRAISSEMIVDGEMRGGIEAFLVSEAADDPLDDIPPEVTAGFLSEEQDLLDEFSRRLGLAITRLRAHRALEDSERQLRSNLLRTVQTVARMVEKRDPYTAGHQERVAALAVAIGREMGFNRHALEGLRLGGLIHDVGKIHIPAEILTKPGRFSPQEYNLIKTHAQAGYDIIKDVEFPWPLADMVHQHHERLDGSGYPRGISGDAICLEARILAVADVVEAITAHRPYRPSQGFGAAIDEIRSHKGTRYDPDAVDACLRVLEDEAFDWDEALLGLDKDFSPSPGAYGHLNG